MTFNPGNRLIVALDVADRYESDKLIDKLKDTVTWFKVGLELFTAVGPDVVEDYAKAGLNVMLDLKLHDIPETVGRATARAAELGAKLLTIHADGGRPMMEAATRVARASGSDESRLRILAVTILTSLDAWELQTLGISESPERAVLRRAQLAMEAGCDGVVASAHEAQALRKGAPEDFLLVTPGIRPEGADKGDQKRVQTPRAARQAGADMIVCGRPIRDAADPLAMARSIVAELG